MNLMRWLCVHVCTFFSVHWYGMANTVLCRLGSFVIIDKNFIFSFAVAEFKITTCTYVCVILLSFFVLFFLRLWCTMDMIVHVYLKVTIFVGTKFESLYQLAVACGRYQK